MKIIIITKNHKIFIFFFIFLLFYFSKSLDCLIAYGQEEQLVSLSEFSASIENKGMEIQLEENKGMEIQLEENKGMEIQLEENKGMEIQLEENKGMEIQLEKNKGSSLPPSFDLASRWFTSYMQRKKLTIIYKLLILKIQQERLNILGTVVSSAVFYFWMPHLIFFYHLSTFYVFFWFKEYSLLANKISRFNSLAAKHNSYKYCMEEIDQLLKEVEDLF